MELPDTAWGGRAELKPCNGKLNWRTDGEGGRGALFLSLVQMSEPMALARGCSHADGGGSSWVVQGWLLHGGCHQLCPVGGICHHKSVCLADVAAVTHHPHHRASAVTFDSPLRYDSQSTIPASPIQPHDRRPIPAQEKGDPFPRRQLWYSPSQEELKKTSFSDAAGRPGSSPASGVVMGAESTQEPGRSGAGRGPTDGCGGSRTWTGGFQPKLRSRFLIPNHLSDGHKLSPFLLLEVSSEDVWSPAEEAEPFRPGPSGSFVCVQGVELH